MVHALTHDDPVQIGSFRLLARLGSGGMGTVYLARSLGGRTLALKTMHARIAAESDYRTRFRLEIDAARVIGGRHGATVIDADPVAPTPWMATEYVLGPSLDDAVALNGPLPGDCVRALGVELCAALRRLHNSDVVHRDLKPSNILVAASGPKVIDFGIARALGDDRLTRTGTAAGTPAFMSPEQATGQEHGAYGDVFALAGVLVFAATGHGPFGTGQPADLLYRVRYGDPDLSGLTGDLRDLLLRCLTKESSQRPGIDELATALSADWDQFADILPDAILAEIGRRCSSVWGTIPERRSVPDGNGFAVTSAPSGVSRRRLLSLVGGSGIALAAAYGGWSWMAADDRGNGSESSSTTSRPPHVAPEAVWRYDAKGINAPGSTQAVGSIVTVPTPDGLVGVDAENGEELWVNGEINLDPITDGEKLFVLRESGSDSLGVAEVDLKSGNFKSQVIESAEFEPFGPNLLTVDEDAIYLFGRTVGTGLNQNERWFFVRFDRKTGEELFRVPFDEGEMTFALTGSTVARIAKDKILMLMAGDTVSVRDVSDGRELWRKNLPKARFDMDAPPAAAQLALTDTHFFYGSDEVLAYRLADGAVSWRFGKGRRMGKDFTEGNRRYGPPAVTGSVVYVSEGLNGIIALNADGGELRWEEDGDDFPIEFDSPPVPGDKYVYGTVDDLRWISAVHRKKHTSMWTYNGSGEDSGSLRGLFAHREAKRLVFASGRVVTAIPLE